MKLDEFQKDNMEKAVIIIKNCLMKNKDRQVATPYRVKKYYSIYEINHENVKLMIKSTLALHFRPWRIPHQPWTSFKHL